MSKIFVVSPILQKVETDHWCFGTCKLISVGSLNLGPEFGIWLPCRHEDCPHEERHMDEAFWELGGDLVYLRKLRPVE